VKGNTTKGIRNNMGNGIGHFRVIGIESGFEVIGGIKRVGGCIGVGGESKMDGSGVI
jgi:hypothetical protein